MALSPAELEPGELLLAGYVPLCASGFALPCYASRPRANAWHAAVCSIEADHRAAVAGFESYDGGFVEMLPEPIHIRVRAGDPWTDVFLWDGEPHVGTPAELMAALRPSVADMRATIPLSLVDLAMAAGEPGVDALVSNARNFVEAGRGVAAAERWLRGFTAGQARLAVRRRLAAAGIAGPTLLACRDVDVVRADGGFAVHLPEVLVSGLSAVGLLEPLQADLAGLGRSIGVGLGDHFAPAGAEVAAPPAASRGGGSTDGSAGLRTASAPDVGGTEHAPRVLVAFAGANARAVARHVSPPDWVPVGDSQYWTRRWLVRRGGEVWPQAEAGVGVIDVLPVEKVPSFTDDYQAVVWLLDDGIALDEVWRHAVRRKVELADAPRRTVHLLAPTLPTHEPSRTLAALGASPGAGSTWDAALDTSLARSPFWTGNPWRAVDRRLADVAVGSAVVSAVGPALRRELLDGSPRGTRSGRDQRGLRLLSFELDGGPAGAGRPRLLGFASESSATGLSRRDDGDRVLGFAVAPLHKSMAGVARGRVCLRAVEPRFSGFARALLATVVGAPLPSPAGDDGIDAETEFRRPAGLTVVPIPPEIAATLRAPEFAAGFGRRGRPDLIVMAETPSLKAVRSAGAKGLTLVRYTDRETLAELLAATRADAGPQLPRELRLPKLERVAANRGLATRGVDPRDVVRIPLSRIARGVLEALEADGIALSTSARGYRSRVGPEEIAEVAIPRERVRAALEEDGSAVDALAELIEPEVLARLSAPLKRPADLRVAWSARQEGTRRFVVEDGVLPARFMELDSGTVPAQRMFIVDGDAAVPLLLGSRLFSVWARATTSRSTSWLSRFSVGRTFETLPIPPGMALRRREGRVALRLERDASQLAEVAARLDARQDDAAGRRVRGGEDERAADAIRHDADAALLDAIDLRSDATDVDVLERLIELNHRSGTGD